MVNNFNGSDNGSNNSNLSNSSKKSIFSKVISKKTLGIIAAASTAHGAAVKAQGLELYTVSDIYNAKVVYEPTDKVKNELQKLYSSDNNYLSSIIGTEEGDVSLRKEGTKIVSVYLNGKKVGEYSSEGYNYAYAQEENIFETKSEGGFNAQLKPTAVGINPELSYGTSNSEITFSIEQILKEETKTKFKAYLAFLYAGEKLGTSIYIEKDSDLSKYLLTQGFAFSGGKIKLTAGLLEKLMDFTFNLESSDNTVDYEDVKMKQKVAAIEYSHDFENNFVKKISTSIVYFDVDGKELGYLEDIIVNTDAKYEWNKKFAGIQGGSKLLGEISTLLRITDNFSFEPSVSYTSTNYKDIGFSEGVTGVSGYTSSKIEYGAEFKYQPTSKDEISLNARITENYNEYNGKYSHKFGNGFELSATAGVNDPVTGDRDYNVGIQGSYSFGGPKNNTSLFNPEPTSNKFNSPSDLTPISRANVNNIEVYKQVTWKDRIAYIDKTLLSEGDTVEKVNGVDMLILSNDGFTVTAIRSVNDSNYSAFFSVVDGQLALSDFEGAIAQMKADGYKEGEGLDLSVSVDDNSTTGISVYDITIEYGSLIIKKTQRVHAIDETIEKEVLDGNMSMDEAQEEADKIADDESPVATGETITLSYGESKSGIDVLSNDTDNSGSVSLKAGGLSNAVGGTFTINNGKIDYAWEDGFSGTASVKYIVTDEVGNESTATLSIVIGDNQAPEILSTLSNISQNEGTEIDINLDQYFSELDGQDLEYLVTGLPEGLEYSNSKIIGTLSEVDSDTDYTVTVIASDGDLTATQTFTITVVDATNYAPTSTEISSVSQNEGTLFSLDLSGHYSDPEGDTLTYSVTGLPSGLSINSSTGVISGTLPTVTSDTANTVTVTAADGNGGTTSQTFTLTVLNGTNDVPTSTVISGVSQNEGTLFNLDLSSHFSDPNGDILTYSATGLPSGLSIDTATGIISGTLPSVTSDTANTVTVTAADGNGGTTSQTFTLTVLNSVNEDPVSTGGETITQNMGTTVSLDLSSHYSDPNRDILTYSATGLPSGLSINSSTGVISGILPTISSDTTYSITVTASDGNGGEVSSVSYINSVYYDDEAPTGSPINLSAAYSETLTGINLLDGYSDNSGSVSFKSGSLVVVSGTGSFSVTSAGIATFTPNGSGATIATYTVKDASGNETTGTITVNVAANNVPTISTISNDSQNMGTSYSKDISSFASDLDGDTLTYSQSGLPTGLSINSSTGVISGTLPTISSDTTYTVTVYASDGVETASSQYTIEVLFVDNEAPEGSSISLTTPYNETLSSIDLLDGYTDNSGSVSFKSGSLVVTSGTGSFSVNSAGVATFTSTESGTTTATYIVQDASGNETTGTISIEATNAAPVITPTSDFTFSYTVNNNTGTYSDGISESKTVNISDESATTVVIYANLGVITINDANGGTVTSELLYGSSYPHKKYTITGANPGTISYTYTNDSSVGGIYDAGDDASDYIYFDVTDEEGEETTATTHITYNRTDVW